MSIETKATPVSIHPGTLIGKVVLTVANLANQLEFYQKVLGFKLHWQRDGAAGLGAGGADLLELHESVGARRYARTTGLYHFAILFPTQRELAKAVARLFRLGYRNHPTDHIMTKTTYLTDPEGQEIELYAESPEDGSMAFVDGKFAAVRADGSPSDGREPLDLDALFGHLQADDHLDDPLPAETRIGHVHLYMRNLTEALRFYNGVVGFDIMGAAPQYQAGFVSAGGYHHHLGLNTWMGEGAPAAPAGSQGLRYFTVVLPNQTERETVLSRVRAAGVAVDAGADGPLFYDPSGNGVVLTIAEDS